MPQVVLRVPQIHVINISTQVVAHQGSRLSLSCRLTRYSSCSKIWYLIPASDQVPHSRSNLVSGTRYSWDTDNTWYLGESTTHLLIHDAWNLIPSSKPAQIWYQVLGIFAQCSYPKKGPAFILALTWSDPKKESSTFNQMRSVPKVFSNIKSILSFSSLRCYAWSGQVPFQDGKRAAAQQLLMFQTFEKFVILLIHSLTFGQKLRKSGHPEILLFGCMLFCRVF